MMLLIMLIVMQRGRINTVTDFPVLIPANANEQEGFATFLWEIGPLQPVRAMRNSDLKGASRVMSEQEAKHFSAVMMLRHALGSRLDPLALKKASELLRDAYGLKRKEHAAVRADGSNWEDSDFARALASISEFASSKEALEVYEGLRPGPRASADARWLLSYEVSTALHGARLVLWWNKGRFLPAVWCRNMKTAFYARALLDIVGTKSFRVCPFCGGLFQQRRPDQEYCSISHREAHRVARWRASQKLKLKRGGHKRGTRKTR
jgi:hypothetical protein